MPVDAEAYQLVVDLLGQARNFGESVSNEMELWIGISSGLVVLADFAPDRLKPGMASFVICLYIAFSVFIFANIAADAALSRAAVEDASRVATELRFESSELKYRLEKGGSGSSLAARLFLAGLFLGAIWCVTDTAYQIYRRKRDGI
jgi:NADH:ubiquinone oxidoreductase subunit H